MQLARLVCCNGGYVRTLYRDRKHICRHARACFHRDPRQLIYIRHSDAVVLRYNQCTTVRVSSYDSVRLKHWRLAIVVHSNDLTCWRQLRFDRLVQCIICNLPNSPSGSFWKHHVLGSVCQFSFFNSTACFYIRCPGRVFSNPRQHARKFGCAAECIWNELCGKGPQLDTQSRADCVHVHELEHKHHGLL